MRPLHLDAHSRLRAAHCVRTLCARAVYFGIHSGGRLRRVRCPQSKALRFARPVVTRSSAATLCVFEPRRARAARVPHTHARPRPRAAARWGSHWLSGGPTARARSRARASTCRRRAASSRRPSA
eukprot:6587226-Prymnesium_polylepis.2